MKKVIVGLLSLGASLLAAAQTPVSPPARPKLVVGIVVDQMRWDYLHRFGERYGEGGFRRLLREGFSCDATYINYVPTVTAIGHASIYSGTVPAIHGMAGNDFILQSTGKSVYCVGDDTVEAVGAARSGGRSPRNLLTSTITDELKLATHFRSKVIGVGLKDRGAILPAGHAADGAYWFDDASGTWGTSTYYMKTLPGWVDDFNAKGPAASYAAATWEPLYPLETYVQSVPDPNPYERELAKGTPNRFPLEISKMGKDRHTGVRLSYFGDKLTLEFAKAALDGERMGQGAVTDFLAVSLSSPDAAGHVFGTNSPRMEDLYLRLDGELGAFFKWLDERYGRDGYLVFLTADHGAAHTASFLTDNRIPGGAWPARQHIAALNELLRANHGEAGLVVDINNYRVCLNNPLIAEKKLDEGKIREACVRYFQKAEGVAFAVDVDRVPQAVIPAPLREQIINGYHAARSGVVQIVLEPGWYAGSALGTTHGTWNPYDAHIPLVWMGWGIAAGRSSRTVHITDIAPTLAALLSIQVPNGCIGEAIPEVLAHRSK